MHICFFGALDCMGRACGVSNVTRILMAMFREHGHRVTAMTYIRPQEDVACFMEEGFVFLPDPTGLTTAANIAFLQEYCLKNRVELIINQENRKALTESFGMLRQQGVKVISCVHNDPAIALKELRDKIEGVAFSKHCIARWLYRTVSQFKYPRKYRQVLQRNQQEMQSVAQNSDRVVLLSDGFKPVFLEFLGTQAEAYADKVCTIPNPLQTLKATDTGEQVNRNKWLLWIGRMRYKQKRPDRMVQIWERIAPLFPDWELLMLGVGDAKADLAKYARRHRLKNIRFCGRVNSQEYYPQAEILCSTSTVEGFPMVFVEALAYGVVPVSFDGFPSAHELIHDKENGLLVTPYSIDEYVEKLQQLMKNADERNRLRKDSVTSLAWLKQDVVYGKWEKLLVELSEK